jgi:hypothetical protein
VAKRRTPKSLSTPNRTKGASATSSRNPTVPKDYPSRKMLGDTSNTLTAQPNKDDELIDGDLWIYLYHHLLLVACLHPSKPVAWLYNTNALQYFDAYYGGRIGADGIVGVWPPRRESAGRQTFIKVAQDLTPRLVTRIKTLSEHNRVAEPANRSSNPFSRERLWKFIITSVMVSQYLQIRESIGAVDGEILGPENHPVLFQFLLEEIKNQYPNRSNWVHKSTGREVVLKQQPRDLRETFEPTQGMILAIFEGKVDGTNITYHQENFIPEMCEASCVPAVDDEESSDQPKFYIRPDRSVVLVPPRLKSGKLWRFNNSTQDWSRQDGLRWKPVVVLRKFRTDTDEYVDINVRLNMIKDADPNDAAWVKWYNAWVNQWNRRSTGSLIYIRQHWTTEEHTALWKAANLAVSTNGLDCFTQPFQPGFLQSLTDRVNEASSSKRPLESIKSMLRRKDNPVYLLKQRAKEVKARIAAGENVPTAERYPTEAIPIPTTT